MAARHASSKQGRSDEPNKGNSFRILILIVGLPVIFIGLGLGWFQFSAHESARESINLTSPERTGQTVAKLYGRWQRTDGAYFIAVKEILADGRVTAEYFNPRPIHVARAEVRSNGDRQELFIELKDAGYPGSTYTLHHDPTGNTLKGTYYQAAQGRQYDVAFARMP